MAIGKLAIWHGSTCQAASRKVSFVDSHQHAVHRYKRKSKGYSPRQKRRPTPPSPSPSPPPPPGRKINKKKREENWCSLLWDSLRSEKWMGEGCSFPFCRFVSLSSHSSVLLLVLFDLGVLLIKMAVKKGGGLARWEWYDMAVVGLVSRLPCWWCLLGRLQADDMSAWDCMPSRLSPMQAAELWG